MLNHQPTSNFMEFNSPGFVGAPFAGYMPEYRSVYQTPTVCDSVQANTTDSGLTYNVNVVPASSRKRLRDSITNHIYAVQNFPAPEKHVGVSGRLSEDNYIWQYQSDVDYIISQHTKKIRLELEERRRRQARLLAAALGEGVMRKLKEKDEQIQRMGRLNMALQDRVKNIFVENQLWRDLAQSNEATVNALRVNLEQALSHVGGGGGGGGDERRVEEDVASCCGSSDEADEERRSSSCFSDRKCKMCGERESCVLLLPCRHLCLCGVCGSGSRQLQECPVCKGSMNATLHVNMT